MAVAARQREYVATTAAASCIWWASLLAHAVLFHRLHERIRAKARLADTTENPCARCLLPALEGSELKLDQTAIVA